MWYLMSPPRHTRSFWYIEPKETSVWCASQAEHISWRIPANLHHTLFISLTRSSIIDTRTLISCTQIRYHCELSPTTGSEPRQFSS